MTKIVPSANPCGMSLNATVTLVCRDLRQADCVQPDTRIGAIENRSCRNWTMSVATVRRYSGRPSWMMPTDRITPELQHVAFINVLQDFRQHSQDRSILVVQLFVADDSPYNQPLAQLWCNSWVRYQIKYRVSAFWQPLNICRLCIVVGNACQKRTFWLEFGGDGSVQTLLGSSDERWFSDAIISIILLHLVTKYANVIMLITRAHRMYYDN